MQRGNKRKFGREKKQRKALYKALVTSLIEHGKIKTTEAKAKSLAPVLDKLIKRAIKNDAVARKYISELINVGTAKKLTSEIGPKLKDRKGGYTRITKLGQRRSDGAPMALIEFTS